MTNELKVFVAILAFACLIIGLYFLVSTVLGNIYGTYPRNNSTITVSSYIGRNEIITTDGRGFKLNMGINVEPGKTYDIRYYVDPKYGERWIMESKEKSDIAVVHKCSIFTEGECV